METTTIQVTKTQREELERLKQQGDYNSLKAVIAELIESGEITVSGIDEAEAREVARDIVTEMVSVRALE